VKKLRQRIDFCAFADLNRCIEGRTGKPFDSPEAMERMFKRGKELQDAKIVSIYISEEQAGEILRRLWPERKRSLLGATSGKGFLIESAEQAAIINEVLANHFAGTRAA
jgi:hypothetical protein